MLTNSKLPLSRHDIYVVLFSFLWIGAVLIDYFNKHTIYFESFENFRYLRLSGFVIFYVALITYIYGTKSKLKKWGKYFLSTIFIFSIPVFIVVVSLGYSKHYSQNTELADYVYLTTKSVYFLFNVFVLFLSGYVIGNKFSTRFLDKKVMLRSHFTLHIVIGVVLITSGLILLGTFGLVNFWSAFILIFLPLMAFYKITFYTIKDILAFDPNYSRKELALILFLLFFALLNFLFVLGPFPLGFDSRNLYANIPNLIAQNNGLIIGFQPHNWELFSSLGQVFFLRAEVTLIILQVGGILSAMAAFYFALSVFKLIRWHSLLIVAILFVTPAISRQMFIELKVDLALLFFQIVTLQFVISHLIYKNKSKESFYVFPIILGVLFGFGLGIKLLHIMLIFGVFVALSYKNNNPFSIWAVACWGLSVVLFLRLDDQTGLRAYHKYADEIMYCLFAMGVILIGLSSQKDFSFAKKITSQYLIISLFTVLMFSPWVWNNYKSYKRVDVKSLFRGGGGGHGLDYDRISESFDKISTQQEE